MARCHRNHVILALEILAELGRLTQVILFTHHRQVAGQANALGEAHGVAVHELGA